LGYKTFDSEHNSVFSDKIHSSLSVLPPGDLKNNAVDPVVTYVLQQDIQPKSLSSVNENYGKAKGDFLKLFALKHYC
jgi:hypothetical protein